MTLVAVASSAISCSSVHATGSGSQASFDFNDAYQNAANGAVIHVPPGRYGAQEILKDTSKSLSGPAVTFVPDGPVYLDGGLYLGSTGGCVREPPNWITFDGGASKNFIVGDMQHESGIYGCPVADHLTLRNMRIGNGMPASDGVMSFRSPSNLVIENSVIGPVCCGTDASGASRGSPILLRLTVYQSPNPKNVTIRNNVFEGTARFCSDWNEAGWNTKYGACPRATCTDLDLCHNDSIHSYGAANLVIERNRFPFYDVQGIFLEEVNGGSNVSGRIENNFFGHDLEGTWHAIWASFGPGATGTWNIRFNTLLESGAIDANASDQQGRYGTATVNVIGNLGGRLGNDTRACQGSTLNVVYRYNIWRASQSPWLDSCDATDGTRPGARIASWLTPEGKLLTNASPPNGFVRAAPTKVRGGYPAYDLAGNTRPRRWPLDAGAYQWETALMVMARSIGSVRLGEREADVVAFYGKARRRSSLDLREGKVTVRTYRLHGGNVSVYSDAGVVVGVGTTSPYYSTAAGVGVGTDMQVVRSWPDVAGVGCRNVFARRFGGDVVYVRPTGGKTGTKIGSVTMIRRSYGFGACASSGR